MLNALANTKFDANDIASMLEGHHRYIEKNTGLTLDGEVQHYLVNPEGIFSNNRHFIKKGGQLGMPNGDAPTESQSLCIIGYCYSYMATKEKKYLDAAIKYFDAYVKYFYAGQPIPDTPSITNPWISNWLVNGKEPVLASYPLSTDGIITHAGWRDREFAFTPKGKNGELQCTIPQDTTYWGQYIDRATFAYVGALGWKSIVATVYGLKPDGVTIDWSDASKKRGKQFDVEWIVDRFGRKVSYDLPSSQAIIEQHASEPIGTVQLYKQYTNLETNRKEDVPPGTYKLCYATRNPLNKDVPGANGFMLERNMPWHNRPLNVPAGWNGKFDAQGNPIYDDYQQLGNSSDSEQWFADAAYLLWKITKDDKYSKAYQAIVMNTYAYSDIDAHDKFFRVDKTAENPWTDGIAYDYRYPNGDTDPVPVITRDANTGYIHIECAKGIASHTMEQQAVWYKVNGNSEVVSNAGGFTANNDAIGLNIEVRLNRSKQESTDISDVYTYPLKPFFGTAGETKVPLKRFVRSKRDDGSLYYIIGNHVSAWSNNLEVNRCKLNADWADNVFEQGRDGGFTTIKWPFEMDPDYVTGASLGITWSWPDIGKNPDGSAIRPKVAIDSLVYRSNVPFTISYTDTDGWAWTHEVPATGTNKDINQVPWGRHVFRKEAAKFNNNQPNHKRGPWFREIRNDKDLGASHESWYIPGKYPAHREYYNGYYTSGPYIYNADGSSTQMQNSQWQDPRWTDIENVGGVIRGYPGIYYNLPPVRGGFPNGGTARQAWIDKDFWVKRGDTNHDPDPTWFDPHNWGLNNPAHLKIYDHDGRLIKDYTPNWLPSSGIIDEQFDITFVGDPKSSPTSDGVTQIYCVNDLPPLYPETQERYLMLYSITANADQSTPVSWTWEVGDCYVDKYLPGNLAYTPGVIPFSNIYSDAGTSTFDGWHGMPYPGYQYPFIYVEDKPGYSERMNNMINFMYDSQKAYADRYGIVGPGMSAFLWNRWDNYKYVHPEHGDKVDGFTMYHWGTDNAWSGYQARAYFGAARCWYELKTQNRPIPPKLIEYVDNWAEYLYNFMTDAIRTHGRPISPTDWSMTGANGVAKPLPGDYTPHMCALFLAGSCFAALAGTKFEMIESLVELLASELTWKDYDRPNNSHYWNTGIKDHVMNGGIGIPWEFDDSNKHDFTNNSTSYGFHTGEVMRGLGVYLLYKKLMGTENPDMYNI